MAVTVICNCGTRYELKDEFLGKLVECPKCHAQTYATGQHKAPLSQEGLEIKDPIFGRDKFLLRQKHFAISEKYYVWDERGNKLLYVERPAYVLRNILALFTGIISAIIVFIILAIIAASVKQGTALEIVLWISAIFVSLFTLFAVATVACKKRHVHFYLDDTKSQPIMKVCQENKFQMVNAYYTLVDNQNNVLARLRKNILYNLFRRRWFGYDPQGSLIFIAREDSIILSLLRRVLGNFFGILRMNFEILDKNGNNVGEFNRKLTILDRYVLDMSADFNRAIDRRIALALGVMLDTGERR